MDSTDTTPQIRVNSSLGVIPCKNPACKTPFIPARKDQVFHTPKCKAEFYRDALTKGVKAMSAHGSMHVSSVKTSTRLQKLLEFLSDGRPHSTRQIGKVLGLEAVGSSVGEIRRNGYKVDCHYVGQTETGAKIYEYTLREGV